MDISVLPLAEVDLKVGDVAIKFENDDEHEEYGEIRPQYEADFSAIPPEVQVNLNLVKEEPDRYDKVNYHFLSPPAAGKVSGPTDPLRRFQCTACLKFFTRNDHLKNHMRTHTGERPFECDQCQRSFAKHFDLTRHKQYVHGSVTTFFICEECGRTFSRKDHLKSHLVTHKNRPPVQPHAMNPDQMNPLAKTFACETCGRTYCRLENLKRHMEKHCENLAKSAALPKGIINDLKDESITENMFKGINFHFMSVNDVKARVDTALRSFACEFCERLFVRKDHLKNHERTHTGERPFQCDRCDKRFAKRFVMTRHLRNVHRINTKMHKCPECERMFARTDHLKTHMKIHILAAVRNQQKEKMHKCTVCDREFTRGDNLKTHMKIHMLAAVKMQQQQQYQLQQQQHHHLHQQQQQQQQQVSPHSDIVPPNLIGYQGQLEAAAAAQYYGMAAAVAAAGRNYFCEVCEHSFPDVEKLEEHERTHQTGKES